MKDLIKKLEAKGIKVTNNRISKADVEKAVKILNKMTASTVANTPNKELQEKLESVVAEAEDLGIDISDYFESSCTNGYDNGGSTGLRIFKNGMKFGILAQNSPVYQVDGENTSYFLFGDDNAKKTIGHISEDIKNNGVEDESEDESEADVGKAIKVITSSVNLLKEITEAKLVSHEYDSGDDRSMGTIEIEFETNKGKLTMSAEFGSDGDVGEYGGYTIQLNGELIDVDGPDFGLVHYSSGSKAVTRFENAFPKEAVNTLLEWVRNTSVAHSYAVSLKDNSEAQATSKIYKIDAYEMLVDHTTGGHANWFAEVIADSINENAGTLLCEAKGNDLVFNEISNIPSDKLFGEVVIKGDSWLIYTIDIENSVVSVEDGPDFEAKD